MVSTSSETQDRAAVRLPAAVNLHARPAAELVRTALAFQATIAIGDGAREANAKSLLEVLALGMRGGSMLQLSAQGPDAASAIRALTTCITGLAG